MGVARAAGAARALLDQPTSPGLRRPPTRPADQPAARPRPAESDGIPGRAGRGDALESKPRPSGAADRRPGADDVAHGRSAAAGTATAQYPASSQPEGRAGGAVVRPTPAGGAAKRDEDDEPTEPLPVILPRGTGVPRPVVEEARPRGPFEPATPQRPPAGAHAAGAVAASPAAVSDAVARDEAVRQDATSGDAVGRDAASGGAVGGESGQVVKLSPSGSHLPPLPAEPLRNEPPPVNPRLESLKDLYFTAAAIGEEALDKHFDAVSRRQRELIQEYFDKSPKPGAEA
jgi:hypothetical protein